MTLLRVRSWGIAGSVQDAGRPGRAWLGASRGGAVDLASLALANRLVGNPEGATAFESSGGLVVELGEPAMVVVTGAVAEVHVDGGPPVGWGGPVVLPARAVLRIGRLLDGARTYIAVRGGLALDGDVVRVGDDPGASAATQAAPRTPRAAEVAVWPGPRLDWFGADAWDRLIGAAFTVTSTSRVGTRLAGSPLSRVRIEELPSEGMVEGAVQVPPDGDPIVMLADHPTTGGYPVVAVVDPGDVGVVAQAAVGTTLRFRAVRVR
ncbi:MAG: biotin-dependent carboxyltransferase family protein [Ilumatobacteraceae bacterium]